MAPPPPLSLVPAGRHAAAVAEVILTVLRKHDMPEGYFNTATCVRASFKALLCGSSAAV